MDKFVFNTTSVNLKERGSIFIESKIIIPDLGNVVIQKKSTSKIIDVVQNRLNLKRFVANYNKDLDDSEYLTKEQKANLSAQAKDEKYTQDYVSLNLNTQKEILNAAIALNLSVKLVKDASKSNTHEVIRFSQVACVENFKKTIRKDAEVVVETLKKIEKKDSAVLSAIDHPIIELFAHPKYSMDANLTYKVIGQLAAKDVFRIDGTITSFMTAAFTNDEAKKKIEEHKEKHHAENMARVILKLPTIDYVEVEGLAFIDQNTFLMTDLNQLSTIKKFVKHRLIVMIDGLYYNRKSILDLMEVGQKLYTTYFYAMRIVRTQSAFCEFVAATDDIGIKKNALIYYRIGDGSKLELPTFEESMNNECNMPTELSEIDLLNKDKVATYEKAKEQFLSYRMDMHFLGGDPYTATLIPEIRGVQSITCGKNHFAVSSIQLEYPNSMDIGYACTTFVRTIDRKPAVISSLLPVFITHTERLTPLMRRYAQSFMKNSTAPTAQTITEDIIKKMPEINEAGISSDYVTKIVEEEAVKMVWHIDSKTNLMKKTAAKVAINRGFESFANMWLPLTIVLIILNWFGADPLVTNIMFAGICYMSLSWEIPFIETRLTKLLLEWYKRNEYQYYLPFYLSWALIFIYRMQTNSLPTHNFRTN